MAGQSDRPVEGGAGRGPARHAGAAGEPRVRDPEVPAVRHRPDHQPHRGLRGRHRAPGRAVRRPGAAGHAGAPFHAPVAVALSTLVAAALFNPLRRRVQRTVDRRFNRARYDAERTVAAFAARLQDHVELGEVRADLLDVVNAALEPAHLSVWTTPAGPRP